MISSYMTSHLAKPFFNPAKRAGSKTLQGRLHLAGGSVKTPTFMPVGTRGAVKGLDVDQVRSTGAKILLGNTYHLHISPGENLIKKLGGLLEITHWQGPMLTDSGGFQVFSLGHVNKISDDGVWFRNPANGDEIFLNPEISMQIQHKLGADIIMAFDDVVGLDKSSRQRTNEAMKRTHLWLERSISEHNRLSKAAKNRPKGRPAPKLFGIVQGGMDKRLRKASYEFIAGTGVDGIAIGGLAVGETRTEMNRMLDYLAPMYDDNRPHYLMGVGHPADMRYAIERGIDMFDSVLPTRNGRHGSFWHLEGGKDHQSNIKREKFTTDTDVLDTTCDCTTCNRGYTRSYLRHLVRNGETLGGTFVSIHNLRYVQRICEEYQ